MRSQYLDSIYGEREKAEKGQPRQERTNMGSQSPRRMTRPSIWRDIPGQVSEPECGGRGYLRQGEASSNSIIWLCKGRVARQNTKQPVKFEFQINKE